MNKSEMTNYMRQEMWADHVEVTIDNWEKIQGVTVSDDVKAGVVKFMHAKIKKGIKKNTLTRIFMQIAVTALLHIKTNK